MLSQYTSKYIKLLSSEVKLYEWAKNNNPVGYDLPKLIGDYIKEQRFVKFCSSESLKDTFNDSTVSSANNFCYELLDTEYWNYRNIIYDWINSLSEDDRDKAFIFLAKTVNRFALSKDTLPNGLSGYRFGRGTASFISDFNSLPLKEAFLKTTSVSVNSIEKSSWSSFANFDNNHSFYADHNSSFRRESGKEKFLKWFLAPTDVSIQVTPNSYTQIGNPELVDNGDSGVSLKSEVIYFEDGYAKVDTSINAEEFTSEIPKLEKYALEIQEISKYSIIDMNIDIMLERLKTAAELTSLFTLDDQYPTESISYKLIFSIAEQKSVVVPSVDMYQSLLYLKSMGSEKISLYYDAYEKRVVIKGKEKERVKTTTIAEDRFGKDTIKTEVFKLPTFAIIYEQKLSELTSFSAIEYVEFFNHELTFRDKYDLLNTKRNSPLELPADFIEEYPAVAVSYKQQTDVSLSSKSREKKYDYAEKVINEYLNSYTEVVSAENYFDKDLFSKLSDEEKGKNHRISIESDEWKVGDYVLKVNEAYWSYNSSITTEELLSFFISKGNNEGYRMLSLKILGLDYHLFEQPIINALLQSNDIYVSKLQIDESNITAEINYEGKNSFISGNIYDKKSSITAGGDNTFSYKKGLDVFFGDELGSNIYDKSVTTIESAIESRFTPALVPLVKDEKEIKALELNIDISCPIFFSGEASSSNSSEVPVSLIKTFLSTGSSLNNLNMIWGSQESKRYSFGHYQLFSNWLTANEPSILGQYTVQEIEDCYIYPISQDEYTYKYVFPLFKDANKIPVGFNTVYGDQGKVIANIINANESTRLVLKELKYIKSSEVVTAEEAENIKKKFVLLFKARFWAARREGRRLFNEFLRKGIDGLSRGLIDSMWNRKYNNFAKPELNKVPMFPSHSYKFGKKSESNQFRLMEAQKEGIRHVLSRGNSGLFLHEVGFGKTNSSITAISSMMNTGEASRVLFIVPNAVYDKFQDEITGNDTSYGLLPNVNIVLLDNLTESIITNQKKDKKIKDFTAEELETIDAFKSFDRAFNKILESLKRGYVTFPNDPIYDSKSSWEEAFDVIKKELKNYVAGWEKLQVLNEHVKTLNDIYNTSNQEWQEIYNENKIIIDDYDSSDAKIKSASKTIKNTSEMLGRRLSKSLKEHIQFVGISLVDELGSYTKKTMAEKTMLIAKHSAAETKLKPSKDSVLRALMFKEGLGEPSSMPTSLDLSEWANITGLPQNKCKVAKRILTKHPISLERLNIDAVVVDEIHNFNNIVNRAGAKGWEHSGSKTYYNPSTLSYEGRRSKRTETYYSLDKVSRASKSKYLMKYDSTGRASDQKGSKLTTAAICMDIQYRKEDINNVLLLSATPFTDTPFQVISVLGMANYQMLQENGIESAWDFFNNYVDETYKYDLRHDGAYGLFIDVNGYYNDKALSNLITNVSNVKITDEKIEASRPKKAIIPANKMSKDTDEKIASTTNMGDSFDELEKVNSRVQLSENQEKFQEIIRAYITDDEDQRPIKEIFPINEDRITKISSSSLDEEVNILVESKLDEAKEDAENADFVVNFLQGLYDKGRYAQHPSIKEAIDYITVKILKGTIDKPEEDEMEAVAIDTAQMSAVQKLAGKAIGVQQAQQSLVISPYFVNLGDDSYTSTFLPDLEPDPATVFVEQSPKLMFVVESIKQTIKYQQAQLERGEIDKIGGQVIYFDKHNFGYGGKRYNAFELLSEYIARNVEDISDEKYSKGDYVEIATIDGDTKIEDSIIKKTGEVSRGRTSIKNSFNNGDIKILIGSKAIKEGIDLQGNSHTMYICEAEFSPEVAMQLEGRIWRQKNPYDVVRIIYVLAMNTIDSFVYSKINKKVNMIKRMLEMGVYEMNTTQFVIDTKEMLIQLESDPDKLTEIQYQDEIDAITDKVGTIDKKIERLRKTKNDYEYIESRMSSKLEKLNEVYKNLSVARKEFFKNDTIKKDIKKERALDKLKDYNDSGYKKNIADWSKDPKSSYDESKYEISEKEVEDRYLAKIKADPKLNPLPLLKEKLTTDTQISIIEKIAIKVNAALTRAEGIEKIWRRADEESQKTIRDKKVKSIGELNWLAFYDATESMDLAGYMRSLRDTFVDDIAAINVIDTYQAYIKNEGKTLDDIDDVISEFEEEYRVNSAKINDELGFKRELREKWVTALAEREETTDGSINGLIDSMKDSLPLIRLRKKIK
jgi:hypothetical protein